MNDLATTLERSGVTLDDLVRASHRLERLRAGDRLLLRQRALARRGGAAKYADLGLAKPRSGRGLSRAMLAGALAGAPLSPVVRGKLARALAACATPARARRA